MKKILSAIDKADNKTKTSSGDMKKFLSIMNESSTNRLSMAEQMAVQHYQEPRNDITSPVLNKSKDAKPSMIGKYFKQIEEELSEAEQRYKDRAKVIAERVTAKINGTTKHKEEKPQADPAIQVEHILNNIRQLKSQLDEQIAQLEEYYSTPTDSKSPIPGNHVKGCKCDEVAEGLRDPKDNPCWKGYKPVGTKKKGGRTVPNCVPK